MAGGYLTGAPGAVWSLASPPAGRVERGPGLDWTELIKCNAMECHKHGTHNGGEWQEAERLNVIQGVCLFHLQ